MQAKVSIRLAAVIGIITFFTAVISYSLLSQQVTHILTTEVKKELHRNLLFNKQLLEQNPQEWQTSGNADAWASRIGHALEIRVTLINLNGQVIGDSYIAPGKISQIENHRERPEVKAAIKNGYGENTRYSQTVKEQMLYTAVPVGLPTPYAVLRFSKPLYDIGIFDSRIRNGQEKILLFALFLSITAGVVTSFLFTRPLRNLAITAQKRTHGDFSGNVPVHRKDEIGILARAFNVLSGDIQKMQRSEEWYHAVFSGIREAIIVTDTVGDIILANPAASRIFLIDGAMLKSRPLKQLADNKLQELFAKVHSNRITLIKEEISLITSKGPRIMQISSMPVMKENQFDGTVFVLNDITKLRNLERIRRDFVSSVSHELRTPLTIISGYTETLLEGAMHDPEHATSFLQIILQASQQLTALVNDVLDLSKIESGHIEYQFMAVDIKRVIAESVNLLQLSLNKKEIKLDIHLPDDLPLVYADAIYMEIVIRNLLDNAIKYVDERNGKIRISAFRSNNNIQVEVEDNGVGIAKANLSRIFERFYRVDKARSRQLGGTGLGLSIVKHIVLAHKGNVEVRSRVNQGTVFTIILPIAPENRENDL
ncbi:MAG: ATP-binding protein [Chlorobiales bacterium]|nr:ATP-binding protein [Chlorobiales bacterium]